VQIAEIKASLGALHGLTFPGLERNLGGAEGDVRDTESGWSAGKSDRGKSGWLGLGDKHPVSRGKGAITGPLALTLLCLQVVHRRFGSRLLQSAAVDTDRTSRR
jgi:hypothetical protein